jgi:catechol 2,3-dioxygenase-like lactoylglutathione lyase family enzyme
VDRPAFRPGETNIICRDLDRSLHFYVDVLGFSELGREMGCVHLSLGSRRFLLMPWAKEDREPAPYLREPGFSVDLEVDDLDAAQTWLESHGITAYRGENYSDGLFVIQDPDGNCWEILVSE